MRQVWGGHNIRESRNLLRITEDIKAFDAISVRESWGKKCLDELLHDNVTKVLDPTLMLADKWNLLLI